LKGLLSRWAEPEAAAAGAALDEKLGAASDDELFALVQQLHGSGSGQ
jgi:hypothetical protein